MKKYFVLILVISAILLSCKPDDNDAGNPNNGGSNEEEVVATLPTVVTSEVTEITETTANCGGEVTSDGNTDVFARGVCWSVNQSPTLDDHYTSDGEGVGTYTSELTELVANTTYYVRAYATNSKGTAYGEEVCFSTLEGQDETEDAVVDLGLPSGTKWAAYNVGANKPEQWGEFFAWGEVKTKEVFLPSNCASYEKDLGDISGKPEYDVAKASWGGDWRMPRLEDFEELVTYCDRSWTAVNGVSGYKMVSRINGNHIFLPASGFMNTNASTAAGTEGVLDQGSWGYYWTSTPYDDADSYGYGVNTHKRSSFITFSSNSFFADFGLRFNGFSIRPVKK